MAGFIQTMTKYCYTQNIKALGFMVSERKILYGFPILSILEMMSPGVGPF